MTLTPPAIATDAGLPVAIIRRHIRGSESGRLVVSALVALKWRVDAEGLHPALNVHGIEV